jgi:hypothetical protein
MPLDFPSDPIDGQSLIQSGKIYVYDATKGVWVLLSNESNITQKIATDRRSIAYAIALG